MPMVWTSKATEMDASRDLRSTATWLVSRTASRSKVTYLAVLMAWSWKEIETVLQRVRTLVETETDAPTDLWLRVIYLAVLRA